MKRLLTGCSVRLVVAACTCFALAGAASAQVVERYWAVTGLDEGHALQIHEQPLGQSKVLAHIPPLTAGLPQDDCMTIHPSSGSSSTWCRTEYEGVRGWVDSRFLALDPTPRLPRYAPPVTEEQTHYRGFAPRIRKVSAPSSSRGAALPACRRLPVIGDELVIVCDRL